jgi:hypothetical protein
MQVNITKRIDTPKVNATLSHAPLRPGHRQYHRPIAALDCRLKEYQRDVRGANARCRVRNPPASELGDGRHRVKSEDKSK